MRHPRSWVGPLLAAVLAPLALAGILDLVRAGYAAGADCTFDHVTCRRNLLLGDGLRMLAVAVLLGGGWSLVRLWRRRRRSGGTPRPTRAASGGWR